MTTDSVTSALEQARILMQALPHMLRYDESIVVVKYGGHAMGDDQGARDFSRDMVLLEQSGVNPVVVHGGGPQIGAMLKRLGVAAPRIHVGGLNPHAGESGLFGREEIEIIKPAIDEAARAGIAVSGPFGADTMFHRKDCDAFIVMLHDQGHITAKLLARNATAGLAIGSPILFSSVAHGSGHDIVGKGVADPTAMIEAISRLARANHSQAPA